ncbi:hypothetical protein DOE63_24740 [Salmonella enterica subsp. diarizonae serovar 59:z10:-]|nr:hypothetical protein DOE63_24740 [Salmonella enterica subsp. diarizonae serovar 59:z10:-]
MLDHNRGHDAIQVKGRIIADKTALYGMMHDFGQMLAYPSGDIMHALIIDSFVWPRKRAYRFSGAGSRAAVHPG